MSKELDLHGIKHEDVERLVENFILLNQMPMTIITGNSDTMRNIVMKKCNRLNYYCEQWDSGTIKVLSYADKK